MPIENGEEAPHGRRETGSRYQPLSVVYPYTPPNTVPAQQNLRIREANAQLGNSMGSTHARSSRRIGSPYTVLRPYDTAALTSWATLAHFLAHISGHRHFPLAAGPRAPSHSPQPALSILTPSPGGAASHDRCLSLFWPPPLPHEFASLFTVCTQAARFGQGTFATLCEEKGDRGFPCVNFGASNQDPHGGA